MNEWKLYAVGEGLAKATNSILNRIIGLLWGSFGTSIFTTLIIGSVQMIGGGLCALYQRQNLFPNLRLIVEAFLFGISAFMITVAGLYALSFPDAEIGVYVFISFLSLLPGAFIDLIFFKTRLSILQWCGVFVFLFGTYGMLNFPSLKELSLLPLWVVVACVVPIGLAVNEGLMRAIGRSTNSNPFVNNFWTGLMTVVLSVATLFLMNIQNIIEKVSVSFYPLSAVMGCVVLVMISLKLLTYKSGGTIAHKKIIMQGTYLISAVCIGALFFNEPITVGKIVGIFAFFVSMFCIEHNSV